MTKRLEEVSYLRVFAMLAVVSIHVLNIPIAHIGGITPISKLLYTLQGYLIFAVPCFLFLSMMMISFPLGDGKLDYKTFYKKRSYRILLPYFLWSLLYLSLNVLIGKYGLSDFLSLKNWAYWLLFGKAWVHLYFLPILIGLFLLVPLLLPLARWVKESLFRASLCAFLPQIGIYWLNKLYIAKYFSLFSSTFIWYYYIGFIGLWFGLNYQANLEKLKKGLPLLLILMPIYTNYLFRLQRLESFNTFYYSIILFTYIILVIVLGLLLGQWLTKKIKPMPKLIHFLERYSFGIYLLHPFILLFVRRFSHHLSGSMWLLFAPLLVLIVSLFSGYIVKKTSWFKYLYGTK